MRQFCINMQVPQTVISILSVSDSNISHQLIDPDPQVAHILRGICLIEDFRKATSFRICFTSQPPPANPSPDAIPVVSSKPLGPCLVLSQNNELPTLFPHS